MNNRIVYILTTLALLLGTVGEGARFVGLPTASRSTTGTTISFEVDTPSDVEVAVLDSGGRVVRHLAAGVLGPNAPAPLQKGSLKQTLVWDGKDDQGKPVTVGGLRVRVRLGLKPQLESFLLFEPDATPEVVNLAVAPQGIYVFYHDATANGNQGGIKLALLDREGRHVRQIMPFSARLPYEKIRATGAFQDEQGRVVPRCYNWHTLSFYPDTAIARHRSMSPLSCPVADTKGRLYWLIDGGRLCAVDPDGGIPYPTFMSEPLFPEIKDLQGGRPALCLSSDGKFLYAAGVWAGIYDKNRPVPCVFRIDPVQRKGEVFLGKPDQTGSEKDLFMSPRGVCAVDGLLYVADPDANRIAVFRESDRLLVGEMKLTAPHIVQVHPKTKAVYVCAYVPEDKPSADGKPRPKDANLLKYADYRAAKPLYELALPRTGLSPNYGAHRIALDVTVEPPLIWAPGLPYAQRGRRLACYRDTGSGFEVVQLREVREPWANGPRDLLVDRKRGDLYVKVQGEQWYQFEEPTGKLVRTVAFPKNFGGPYMGSSGAQLGVDSAGNYITHCWGNNSGLMRWSRDLKPLNWEGRDTHRTDWGGMMTFQLNYMAIHEDQIYVIKPVQGPHHLEVYDMGLNLKRCVVWNVRRGSCPRVDSKGNVYITVPIRPLERDLPEFFDGKLGKIPDYYNNIGAGDYWYVYMYGSIVKFPPVGGAFFWIETDREKNETSSIPQEVATKPRVKFQYFQAGHYPHKTCEVQGAEWVRFGYSPYSETYGAGTPVCMCEGTGYDVDAYGRVFYPNLCQFRIEVVDANNNQIGTFGRYGNRDDWVKGGQPEDPACIPLAWPTYVAVSETHAYVNDTVNLRVNKIRLAAMAEAMCDLP
ncbi:MAG: hypothetical protein N2255_06540 [Kiritimatiellae bacterium]|nr:hypothetical protein [Kiritimatiellia bacterium]